MSFLVQKYGGTSVGNPERIRNVANRVAESHKAGHQLVVVVSAMSGVTDSLIKLAREVNPDASRARNRRPPRHRRAADHRAHRPGAARRSASPPFR